MTSPDRVQLLIIEVDMISVCHMKFQLDDKSNRFYFQVLEFRLRDLQSHLIPLKCLPIKNQTKCLEVFPNKKLESFNQLKLTLNIYK